MTVVKGAHWTKCLCLSFLVLEGYSIEPVSYTISPCLPHTQVFLAIADRRNPNEKKNRLYFLHKEQHKLLYIVISLEWIELFFSGGSAATRDKRVQKGLYFCGWFGCGSCGVFLFLGISRCSVVSNSSDGGAKVLVFQYFV